jgi:predicted signal transduction protein with EAL and GGDEF domain
LGLTDKSESAARAAVDAQAKQAPNSTVEIYDESLQRALVARAEVEKDLRTTLDGGGDGFFLQYQPVVDASIGELAFVEALVRWDRPGHGLCQPNDLIPVRRRAI